MATEQRGRDGIHLAIDLSQGSALTWVAGELAVALADLGVQVSLFPVCTLCPTLEPRLRPQQEAVISDTPCLGYDVKLNHCLSQFLMQETAGEIDAELFVTNSRFRGGIHPLDQWSCNLATNDARKLPLSSFCRDSLVDLGVPASRCSVVAPGYSPEIESLFPAGKSRDAATVRRILVVTNSHDLDRYGTDILIPALAKAFSANDPVEIHIKDYGAACGSRVLRELIAAQPSFPKLVWHETFLSKSDLIRLYGDMHLLVAPFRGEGYAMKIIDAMALGLPVMMPAFGGPWNTPRWEDTCRLNSTRCPSARATTPNTTSSVQVPTGVRCARTRSSSRCGRISAAPRRPTRRRQSPGPTSSRDTPGGTLPSRSCMRCTNGVPRRSGKRPAAAGRPRSRSR